MSIHPSASFNWGDDNEDIVAPEQPRVAVYANTQGAVCIRQEAAWDEDEDTVIILQPEFVQAAADAIIAAGRIAVDVRQDIRRAHEKAEGLGQAAPTPPPTPRRGPRLQKQANGSPSLPLPATA